MEPEKEAEPAVELPKVNGHIEAVDPPVEHLEEPVVEHEPVVEEEKEEEEVEEEEDDDDDGETYQPMSDFALLHYKSLAAAFLQVFTLQVARIFSAIVSLKAQLWGTLLSSYFSICFVFKLM